MSCCADLGAVGGRAQRQAGVGLRRHLLRSQGRAGRLAFSRRADRHRRRRPRNRLRAGRGRRPELRPPAVALHPRRRGHGLDARRHQYRHPVRPAVRRRLDLLARHRQSRFRQRHLDRDLEVRRQRHLVVAHGRGRQVSRQPARRLRPMLVVGLRARRRLGVRGGDGISTRQGHHLDACPARAHRAAVAICELGLRRRPLGVGKRRPRRSRPRARSGES